MLADPFDPVSANGLPPSKNGLPRSELSSQMEDAENALNESQAAALDRIDASHLLPMVSKPCLESYRQRNRAEFAEDLTPCEYIRKIWTSELDRAFIDPV